MHEVGSSWISEVHNRSESSSDDLQLPEKQATPRGPKQDTPGRLSSDFRRHKLEKIVRGAAPKKRSETKHIYKFCVGPLHRGSCFEKYHSVTRYWTIYMQFLQSGVRSIMYSVKLLSKNMLWGWTFKVLKMSGNWGHLIKRPSGWQGVKLNSSYLQHSYYNSGTVTVHIRIRGTLCYVCGVSVHLKCVVLQVK